jgi:ADP-heptose:LPS heptosyltransferase
MNRIFEILSPRRRYHEHKPLASLILRLSDLLLLALPTRARPEAGPVQRILLMNPAYNGDVLMSTSVLPLVRRAYPNAEIGFVVGSWARQVVEQHPDVNHVHVVDIFRLNRGKLGLWAKLKRQRETQRQAKTEVRALGYDVAIDLFTGFPPLSWFAWACHVPRRIGFMNRGFGALLTEPRSLEVTPGRHEVAYHVDLVTCIGADPGTAFPHPHLGPVAEGDLKQAAAALGWHSLDDHAYIVIHPGSGEPLREWPIDKWQALVRRLSGGRHLLIFTGFGPREAAQIDRIIDGSGQCTSLCSKLSWASMCGLVSRAGLLIGIDSMSGHLASAWQVPTVTLSTGMADPQRWRPANKTGVALHTNPPCFPCLNRRGCGSMKCVREVSPEVVEAAVRERIEWRT